MLSMFFVSLKINPLSHTVLITVTGEVRSHEVWGLVISGSYVANPPDRCGFRMSVALVHYTCDLLYVPLRFLFALCPSWFRWSWFDPSVCATLCGRPRHHTVAFLSAAPMESLMQGLRTFRRLRYGRMARSFFLSTRLSEPLTLLPSFQ